MSKIETMIQELCPNGVERKRLDEICIQYSGMTGVSNKWADEGNCVFIDYSNVYNKISVDVDALKNATVKSFNQNTIKKGDILFTSASETPDECALSAVVEKDIKENVFLDDHLFGLRLKDEFALSISPSYLKYAFRSNEFRVQVKKVVRGVTRHYISKTDFMSLDIPIPPLTVQRKIVEFLDNFSELTAELTAELEKRKKQYEFYRDKLLSFNNIGGGIRRVKLGDIGTMKRGSGIQKKDFVDSGFPCIHYGQVHTKFGTFTDKTISFVDKSLAKAIAHPGDLIIATTSEDVGACCKAVAWVGNTDIAVSGDATIYHHNQNPKYMSYLFQTKMFAEQKSKCATGAKVIRVSPSNILNFTFPFPAIAEQEQIVSILDRFESLCSDISAGIPAEINARQKQYEYYRDKLLTFNRA